MTKRKFDEYRDKGGRPTDYNDELADYICKMVATHDCGLQKLIAMYPDMPGERTIYRWRYERPGFRQKYAVAKMAQADLYAEQIVDISDDARGDVKLDQNGNEIINSEFVARSRLRVDTRKWLASKLMPKQYGDARQIQALEDKNDELRTELKELRKQLDEKNKKDY